MTNGSKLVKSTSVLNQPIKRPMKHAKKKKKDFSPFQARGNVP